MSPTRVSLHINFKYTIIWYNAVRWPNIFRQVSLPKNLIYLHFQKCIKLSISDILSLPPLQWDPFLIGHPQRLCYIFLLYVFSAFCQVQYKESHTNLHIPTPLPKFFSGPPCSRCYLNLCYRYSIPSQLGVAGQKWWLRSQLQWPDHRRVQCQAGPVPLDCPIRIRWWIYK